MERSNRTAMEIFRLNNYEILHLFQPLTCVHLPKLMTVLAEPTRSLTVRMVKLVVYTSVQSTETFVARMAFVSLMTGPMPWLAGSIYVSFILQF